MVHMRLTVSMLLLLGLVGCASTADESSGDASGVSSSPSNPEPVLRTPKALPSGIVLPPIVDPDGPGSPYFRGEPVPVGDLVIVYLGTTSSAEGLVATFEVEGAMVGDIGALYFLPSGPSVPLALSGGVVTSESFRLGGDAAPSTLFAWLVNRQTIVWELGPVEAR
jgi:hypothetical protein